jgi:hypothetical protein
MSQNLGSEVAAIGIDIGENTSSTWRAVNEITCSWCGVTPGTSCVTLCHHCWLSRKP